MNQSPKPRKNGQFILCCFLGFFGTVGAVDSYFVYTALSTNTGLVTEQPYEKGLAFNVLLAEAKNQPKLIEEASYKSGLFQWTATDKDGAPIRNAKIDVKFYLTAKDGSDFDTKLSDAGNGLYTTKVDFPAPGLWMAKVSAQWNDKTYHTSHQFLVK